MNLYVGNKGGSGKGGKGGSSTPTEDPNNLLSKSTVRIVDVWSEGPIVGLLDGFKSIYLDDTPIQNSDGSFNYKGVSYVTREGTPDQDFIPGFPAVENEIAVGVQVKYNLPISSQISDTDANAVLVKVKVSALTSVDKKTGDMHGTSVDLAFDIKTVSGSFVQVGTMTISGKTTSEYERSQRLELPAGGAPWTLRMRRLTADNDSQYVSNDTYFSTYTIVYDAKLRYPDTALIGYKIDAQQFGSNSPTRVAKIRGIISDVPSNYDPIARTYSGFWNGTFKKAWHNNPAWVLWDLMTNKRYGLGDIINAPSVDKTGLYIISQYCDELVPNGFGGTEPRYTFNGVINSKQNAAAVLDSISSIFRGMIYWGNGSVMVTLDAPATPKKLVAPANVIGGEFSYSGSALKSRHTSALVTWNDPADNGRATVESVQRDDLIQKFGYRPVTVAAYGCTSRGQAHRTGEWLLDVEANETEIVNYSASLDNADLRPGDIISVADPNYAGARFGGRILDATLSQLTIDKGVELLLGNDYAIAVVMEDGSIETRSIISAAGADVSVMDLDTPLPSLPVPGAMWVITAPEAAPRLFRVISNTEKAVNLYDIVALFHDPTKYARIERNVSLDVPNYAINLTGPLAAPIGLTLGEFFKLVGNSAFPAAALSWNTQTDARVSGFELQIQGPNDPSYRASVFTLNHSYDDYPTDQGIYKFRVRSTALFLKPSAWTELQVLVYGPAQIPPDVTGFMISVVGPNAVLGWDRILSNIVDRFEIRFNRGLTGNVTWENSDLLTDSVAASANSATVPARVGTYLIKAVTFADAVSVNAAIVTSEIAGTLVTNVVATFADNPTWAGTKDDVIVVSSKLRLDSSPNVFMSDWVTLASVSPIGGSFLSEGYYYFVNDVDLGSVGTANIDYAVDWSALDINQTMSSWLTLANVSPIATITDEASVTMQLRISLDGVTFGDWQDAVLSNYLFQVIEFRLKLTSTSVTVSPDITSAEITVDMEDRIANDFDVSCPALGLRIDFTPNFMAPPSVHIDGQGLATGDYHHVTSRDETGFNIRFFNSAGTGKSVTFDWIAKGYGYKQ